MKKHIFFALILLCAAGIGYVLIATDKGQSIVQGWKQGTIIPQDTAMPTVTPSLTYTPCDCTATPGPSPTPVPSETFVPLPTTTATIDVNAFCYQEGKTVWLPNQQQLVWVSTKLDGSKVVTGVDPQVSYNAAGEAACSGFRNICPIPVEQFGNITPEFKSGPECPTDTPTATASSTSTPIVLIVTATPSPTKTPTKTR